MRKRAKDTNAGETDRRVDGSERIAIIGAGVSGVAAGNVWKKCGYDVTIFEAADTIGGQWTKTYPGVTLQNTSPQYQFGEFPWPFKPDRHPTSEQILCYVRAAAEAFELDIRLGHRVTRMVETDSGWALSINNEAKPEVFAYIVIATGQYPGGEEKWLPPFENLDRFKGQIVTNIDSHKIFGGKRVVIVGFGKTALDYAAWSAPRAAQTVHVFRTPRWTIPDYLLGIDYSRLFFARFGSDMMPSWVHSSTPQQFLHRYLGGVVQLFWWFTATLFQFQHRRDAKLGGKSSRVLDVVFPPKSQITTDLRSAKAVAPPDYYHHIAHGRILARQAQIESFSETGITLSTGEHIDTDLVCICVGNKPPTYPYLPDAYRAYLENQTGGPTLYRHLIHPKIPRLGFAGYNHGFLHIATCEVGALWLVAAFRGDLQLPSPEEMATSAKRVAQWKQEHTAFEATYNLAVNTRYQQYLDVLLQDLGISQWRKLPNVAAELFMRYSPTDYCGIVAECLEQCKKRRAKGIVRQVMSIDA